ncbi:DUF669 domain-containing protein [Mesomycoplasma lagogenitalium]|uniref:DUF669 domain-containing protein n=1 Tax=Mesomycoplasma lagogenitalium TaxID=171286 RepID=A0ABY8LW09_9BACT|nr:DUF669 domain-containing protein [Mesomycoplasma lagogenitalium]WGI36468.1 DUF669 domain-containing protein [Mesomycoplasma lagogenitalium]
MGINFNKDWEKLAQENKAGFIKLPDGKYNVKIVSAGTDLTNDGLEVVKLKVEVMAPGFDYDKKTVEKVFYIDENYQHKQKKKIDEQQLASILSDLNVVNNLNTLNDKKQFSRALIDLIDLELKLEYKTSDKIGPNGKPYKSKYFYVENEENENDNDGDDFDLDGII